MLESEKFAIAAHLHVLLRRVNGRVTDVEWMIRSPEYAREVIRVARTEEHPELLRLADKLESAVLPPEPVPKEMRPLTPTPAHVEPAEPDPVLSRQRYVGSLR